MEDVHALLTLQAVQPLDGIALLVGNGIAAGSQHHADRRVVLKLQIDLVKRPVNAGFKDLHNVVLHPGQHHLGLRIAKPRVVLQHLRALLCQHQSEEDDAFKGTALRRHGVHGGLINMLLAEFVDLLRVEGTRGEGSHAARIQSLIAVQGPLVILSGGHALDGLSVHKA